MTGHIYRSNIVYVRIIWRGRRRIIHWRVFP